ncbi:hypothetical protein [Streptomyces qinzhouensis]|uniref:Uncharacterized protein n=1 Tax=Streptomyces qinzhouensis TaxID=2599401 RepID=A0A5B8J8W6_9ACTN|nr:hypothetical protein [Streptomyces qinzhouensis]QDY78255.1 hypothetical protein FQU76_19130 [Streptomyces qinzhouensis]
MTNTNTLTSNGPYGKDAGTPRRRRRIALALTALTAVTALTATACGTQQTGGAKGAATDITQAVPASAPGLDAPGVIDGPGLDGPGLPDEELVFMEMAVNIAEPCLPVPPGGRPDPAKVFAEMEKEDAEADGPDGPLPPPDSLTVEPEPYPDGLPVEPDPRPVPDGLPVEPDTSLDPVEECAGASHALRITKAITGLGPNPSPQRVKSALTGIEYSSKRIHGPSQANGTTRYWLDLRLMGGKLGMEISVAGSKVRVTAHGVPETGPFLATQRQK